MTNSEIMKIFRERYGIKTQDYRPLHSLYIPDTEGIVIWTEQGDVLIFFPKQGDEAHDDT